MNRSRIYDGLSSEQSATVSFYVSRITNDVMRFRSCTYRAVTLGEWIGRIRCDYSLTLEEYHRIYTFCSMYLSNISYQEILF